MPHPHHGGATSTPTAATQPNTPASVAEGIGYSPMSSAKSATGWVGFTEGREERINIGKYVYLVVMFGGSRLKQTRDASFNRASWLNGLLDWKGKERRK
eukprot:1159522-Pelagomonas_calceolata.AAC.9